MSGQKKEPIFMGIIFILIAGILVIVLGASYYMKTGDLLSILIIIIGVVAFIMGVIQIKKRLNNKRNF